MNALLEFLQQNGMYLLIIGLSLAWLVLNRSARDVRSTEEFARLVQSGRPAVVLFYADT